MKSKHSKLIESFPIVAIGASAGGLESGEAFLQALPPVPDIAFVIIQHSDPTRK
jgi:two-component system CheB/CheR fusion protein